MQSVTVVKVDAQGVAFGWSPVLPGPADRPAPIRALLAVATATCIGRGFGVKNGAPPKTGINGGCGHTHTCACVELVQSLQSDAAPATHTSVCRSTTTSPPSGFSCDCRNSVHLGGWDGICDGSQSGCQPSGRGPPRSSNSESPYVSFCTFCKRWIVAPRPAQKPCGQRSDSLNPKAQTLNLIPKAAAASEPNVGAAQQRPGRPMGFAIRPDPATHNPRSTARSAHLIPPRAKTRTNQPPRTRGGCEKWRKRGVPRGTLCDIAARRPFQGILSQVKQK